MSKREKIIVGLMVVAILYGAYSFIFSGSAERKRPGAGNAQVPAGEFVTGLIQRIQMSDKTATARMIMSRAADKSKKDPFLVIVRGETTSDEIKTPPNIIPREDLTGAFSYSGFMEMGKRKLAIINGMEYQQGDALGHQGAVLKGISPGEVRISVGGTREVIVVPIEDTGGR